MSTKKKYDQNPLGVPLVELMVLLNASGVKTSLEGNTLLALHEHSTTTIEVVPPDDDVDSDEPIRAVVRVRTTVPEAVRNAMEKCKIDLASEFNPLASLGALTGLGPHMYIGSRITIFESEDAWRTLHLPLLMFTVLSAAPAILGAMRRSIAGEPARGGESLWTASDFKSLEKIMSRSCVCSSSKLGFTAEFELDSNTALFQLRTDQPHPELGAGLFAQLQMPHQMLGFLRADDVVATLNRLEMSASDMPPHFGAWCRGNSRANVAYVSFLPNAMHTLPNIAMNFTMWAKSKAREVNSFLVRMERGG